MTGLAVRSIASHATQREAEMTRMHTRWVELGEGSLLIDLTLAARTIETAAGRGLPLTRAQRDALAAQRE